MEKHDTVIPLLLSRIGLWDLTARMQGSVIVYEEVPPERREDSDACGLLIV